MVYHHDDGVDVIIPTDENEDRDYENIHGDLH
jgi:hypothetical protein